jgi:hypothetical protein
MQFKILFDEDIRPLQNYAPSNDHDLVIFNGPINDN